MAEHDVVLIRGVDGPSSGIREGGAMNGVISSDGRSPAELLAELRCAPSMEGLNLADQVSTKTPYSRSTPSRVGFDQRLKSRPERPYRVAAIDFGIKRAILDRLVAHGCDVTVFPADTDLNTLLQDSPEGVFLSNGPGDPSAVAGGITLAKQLLGQADLPLFGICLGHQILGLALREHIQIDKAIAASTLHVEPQDRSRAPAKTMASPWMRPLCQRTSWMSLTGISTTALLQPSRIVISLFSECNITLRPVQARMMPTITSPDLRH